MGRGSCERRIVSGAGVLGWSRLAGWLIGIDPDGLPYVQHWLERALAYSPDSIPLLDEHELLWTVRRFTRPQQPIAEYCAAATARLTGNAAEIILVGGEGTGWIGPLTDILSRWARDEGRSRLIAQGRAGWRRVLPKHGWTIAGECDGITGYERRL